MNPTWLILATEVVDQVEQTGAWSRTDHALLAIGLLVAAAVLIFLEMLIISFGILGLGAAACAYFAIANAFAVHAIFGWALIVASPLIAVLIIRFGVDRMGRSSLVPKAVIGDTAGISHVAQRVGIEVGSRGELVTDAVPGGRAHFDGGVCDVQARGGALDAGTPVVVKRIDGPMVIVAAAPEADEPKASAPPPKET